ncbi:MAG: type II secretion system inner membrane protein GspF [Planctomycetes bacterium]|nr:type II secretion system inner membrane protein GspF [Planctomycetota bacterium]
MPIFEYKAMTGLGETRSGLLDADSARDAREQLRHKRLHVVEIRARSPRASARGGRPRRGLALAIVYSRRGGEIATVTRQLATLLRSGIPLADALSALIEQVEHRDVEVALRDLKERVTQGAPLAEALAHYPQYFNDLYLNMVKAGEASGNLDVVLARLAAFVQKQAKLRNRVTAAMMYPLLLILIAAVVVVVLLTFVVPRITLILTQSGKELPWMTRTLIGVSNFVQSNWWLLLLGAFAGAALFRAFYQTARGRRIVDRLALGLPVLGPVFKKQAVSRFSVTLSTLLKSGIPVLDGLKIVKNIVNNAVLADVIEVVHTRILEGADIATPLKKSGVFPPVVGYMISVGEQTGQLEEMLDRIAESYDEEIEISTQKMISVLEPLLILVMAVVVGFIILSILIPILQSSDLRGM